MIKNRRSHFVIELRVRTTVFQSDGLGLGLGAGYRWWVMGYGL